MITALQRTRPSGHMAHPEYMCLLTLKALATRRQSLAAEIATADVALREIFDTYAPMLCDLPGVGTEVASQLLVTVGDNPDRLENEAQFAALVRVAPIPASSGKTTRHRLSRGGDRNANHALYQVVLVRMASCQRTKDYVAKRTAEGMSKRESCGASDYLRKTLNTYLQSESNLAETSRALEVHRNTVVKRIEKIEELLDAPLENPDTKFALRIALRILEISATE